MTSKPKRLKMFGSVFLRVWPRGKVTLLTVVVALSLALVTPALAATGGNFILGKANTATDPAGTATGITQLTANIANPAMRLINTSTSAGATALQLRTDAGKPPMTVNSQTKVANLNADSVDDKDSTAFATGTNGKANDADKLDGLDSADFAPAGGPECPSGTQAFMGVCIETEDRQRASFRDASSACASLSGRLPTAAELDAFRQQPNIEIGENAFTHVWTGDIIRYLGSDERYAIVMTDGGNYDVGTHHTTVTLGFHCVVSPSN